MTDLELFTLAFFDALYFTDTGGDGQPNDDTPLDAETKENLEADCRSFWWRFGAYIKNEPGQNATAAGHDFWMTRNGHGVGFWDGDWPVHGERLDAAARAYGEVSTYAVDGVIYA